MSLRSVKRTNPILKKANTFKSFDYPSDPMTLDGTINKITIMFLITILGASLPFMNFVNVYSSRSLSLVAVIFSLVTGLICSISPKYCAKLAPVYALCEGLLLGSLSVLFESIYPGIVFQAILITFGILGAVIMAYKLQIIHVTNKFRMMVFCATGGLFLAYLLTFILQLVGFNMTPLFSNGVLGIGINLAVIALATFNLVLDVDYISIMSRKNLPKEYEWYGAFGLMVTLIWLYLDVLRLLSLLNSRD